MFTSPSESLCPCHVFPTSTGEVNTVYVCVWLYVCMFSPGSEAAIWLVAMFLLFDVIFQAGSLRVSDVSALNPCIVETCL